MQITLRRRYFSFRLHWKHSSEIRRPFRNSFDLENSWTKNIVIISSSVTYSDIHIYNFSLRRYIHISSCLHHSIWFFILQTLSLVSIHISSVKRYMLYYYNTKCMPGSIINDSYAGESIWYNYIQHEIPDTFRLGILISKTYNDIFVTTSIKLLAI